MVVIYSLNNYKKKIMKNIITSVVAAFVFVAIPASSFAQFATPQTFAATNITQTSATLSGSTSGSNVLESYIEINKGNATYVKVGAINGPGSMSGTVSGLLCNTTYFYLSVARFTQGEVSGPELSFKTLPCGVAPQNATATTYAATNITQTSATLSGVTTGAVSRSYSEINKGNANYVQVGAINGAGSTAGTVSGLLCNTTYYFLEVAELSTGGEIAGNEMSFRTLACDGGVGNNVRIINFTASPSYFSNGGGTTNLSWSSENASTCSISGIGSVNTNGTQSRFVGSTQSFVLSCIGINGGSDSRTVTVQVDQVQNNFQINSFVASPSYLTYAGNTTLSWSTTNASTCTLSNQGTVSVNGSQSVYVASTRSFTLSCVGVNGQSDSRTVTVQVDTNNNNNPVRIDSFYASPTNVTNGGYTTMYWTTTNASSCTLGGVNVATNSSRYAGPIYGSQNYTLVCYGINGGSDSRTLYVTTNGQGDVPVISTFTVFATSDNYVTINWSSNADYCIAGGDWSGTKTASGSERVGPFSGTRTFTLTCYRNNQTAVQTQTIFIGGGVQNQNNAAITNIATRIGTSGAQLNGIAVIANGAYSEGWFEYGRTESLGNTTNSRSIGSARTTDFSEVITGLSSNTAYYYRAVMRNNQGTFRGDIERFVTARVSVVTVPTPIVPTQTALTFSRPAFMEITVNQVTLDAVREGEVEYQVNYRSLTNRTLVNTAVKVLLPEEFEYISATRGVYSAENKTLSLNIGEFRAGEQGTIIVRARVLPLAQIGKTVVVTGYANYTVPADSQFLAYQDEVVAYALTTIREGRFTTAQTGSVAAGFFGTDLGMAFGWLLLLLILLAIIYMLRKLYLSFSEAKKA
jgi:hypothetical protein